MKLKGPHSKDGRQQNRKEERSHNRGNYACPFVSADCVGSVVSSVGLSTVGFLSTVLRISCTRAAEAASRGSTRSWTVSRTRWTLSGIGSDEVRMAERSVIVLFMPAEISWNDVWTAVGRLAVEA